MLGKYTYAIHSWQKRLIYRSWGQPSIHVRQKWKLIWPYLNHLPDNLHILDAGCGKGDWVLEIAMRKPSWTFVGIDIDQNSIHVAKEHQRKLGIHNVSFIQADFLDYNPHQLFDVVLSIMSAHYLVEDNQGYELFTRFDTWLNSQGYLFLLGPRHIKEAPFVPWLDFPQWHSVFTSVELSTLCKTKNLRLETLRACIGKSGTIAKQLDWSFARRFGLLRVCSYPLSWLLSVIDDYTQYNIIDSTLMWLLIARNGCENV